MADSEATSTVSSETSVADSTASTAVSSDSTVSQANSTAQSVSSTATSSASSVASAVSNSSSSASSSASSSEPVHLTDQEIYDLNHPKTYMAKAGEDLVSICNRFGVSYGSVANINHFQNAVRPWTNRPYQPPMLLKLRV